MIKNSKPSMTLSKKTFQQDGKWIEKEHEKILTCACGNKYIKTRDFQTTCVKCITKIPRELKAKGYTLIKK